MLNKTESTQRRHASPKTCPKARRGIALVYVLVMLTVLIGLCSLAVDYGHIQVINIQLQRAADAAAEAGAQQLSNGTTATNTAATTVATENTVDDHLINSSQVTVQFVNWISSTNYTVVGSAATANAVKVTISDNVPYFFASILGFNTHIATRSSTAAQVVQTSTQFVSTMSNPWLAGEPTGTQGSEPDPGWAGQGVTPEHPWQYDIAGPVGQDTSWGEQYGSPVQVGITVTPGATITLSNVTGQGNYDFKKSDEFDATGTDSTGLSINYDDEASNGVAEHGIADSTMPLTAVNAVFLDNTIPDSSAAPGTLDFSTQSERDYTAGSNNGEATGGEFAPQLKQVFYVGDGLTSTGQQESIIVPPGATRVFLGTMDGHEWSNNSGGFNVTVSQKSIEIVQ